MKKKNISSETSTQDVSASQKLVEQATAPFENVVRLTADQRKRAVKLRRGAHQVLPLIANLARKYAVVAPGTSMDDMTSNIAYAQSLEPLLGAVTVLHETLRDAYLGAQSSAWKTGSASYSMMKRASKANVNLANELEPVTEWFRQQSKGKTAQATTTDTTPAVPSTTAAVAQPAPAAKSNGTPAVTVTPAPASN